MAFRYETTILGRIVTIRTMPFGQYEVSMQGRGGFETSPRTSRELNEAKIEAHLFVHRTLKRLCECEEEIPWRAIHEAESPHRDMKAVPPPFGGSRPPSSQHHETPDLAPQVVQRNVWPSRTVAAPQLAQAAGGSSTPGPSML